MWTKIRFKSNDQFVDKDLGYIKQVIDDFRYDLNEDYIYNITDQKNIFSCNNKNINFENPPQQANISTPNVTFQNLWKICAPIGARSLRPSGRLWDEISEPTVVAPRCEISAPIGAKFLYHSARGAGSAPFGAKSLHLSAPPGAGGVHLCTLGLRPPIPPKKNINDQGEYMRKSVFENFFYWYVIGS